MDAYSYLFYGLGQVAYAVAMADGKVQKEEEQILNDIVVSNLEENKIDFDYTDTIFKILKSDDILDAGSSYKDGMKNINLGGNHLTDELRDVFVVIINEIAEAFPPNTDEERAFVSQFKEDLEKAH